MIKMLIKIKSFKKKCEDQNKDLIKKKYRSRPRPSHRAQGSAATDSPSASAASCATESCTATERRCATNVSHVRADLLFMPFMQ